jgi:threonine/homoserine/homoserine lactone efflux protein
LITSDGMAELLPIEPMSLPVDPTRYAAFLGAMAILAATSGPLPLQFVLFAAATVILDVTATTACGFGGAALSRRMTEPKFRRGFGIAVAAVLLAAAGLIVSRF